MSFAIRSVKPQTSASNLTQNTQTSLSSEELKKKQQANKKGAPPSHSIRPVRDGSVDFM